MGLQGGRRNDAGRRRGAALIEMVISAVFVTVILLGIASAIAAQSHNAVLLARETRTRLLLEGEMEWLRGRAASEIQPCRDEAFTPALGVPATLADVAFRRTIAVEDGARIARVKLDGELSALGMRRQVVVEGVLFLQEE